MSKCPNCQRVNSQNAKFCSGCGQSLAGLGPETPQLHQNTTRIMNGPRLQVRIPGQPERELPLSPDQVVTIGRDHSNVIWVPIMSASRIHAQVLLQAGGYAVMDMNSSNGTFLQGKRIPAQSPCLLPDGGVIRIGDDLGNSVGLVYLQSETPLAPIGSVDLGMTELKNTPLLKIGRDPTSHIPINSPLVSWKHAELVHTPQGHSIQDLGSTNGTYVNGKRVSRIELHPGDQIQIGPYKLTYNQDTLGRASSLGSVRLNGLKLTKEVTVNKASKRILNEVSLSVMPREFVALVGGSGAGKTTLMDALNGFRRVPEGRVLINGDDLYRNYDAYRSGMGYVPQTDILHTELTVGKALGYTARLRLPPDTPPAVINQHV